MNDPSAAFCGDERPHKPHVWRGVAKLEVGTKYGMDWQCPGVPAGPCNCGAHSTAATTSERLATENLTAMWNRALAAEEQVVTLRTAVANARTLSDFRRIQRLVREALRVGDKDNAMEILQSVNHADLNDEVPARTTPHKVSVKPCETMVVHSNRPRTVAAAGGATQEVESPMRDQRNTATVKVGQRYEGWGKTWEVTRVWKRARVAEIVNTARAENTMRLPLPQFKELRRA